MEDLRLIATEDGSHSLYHAALDETFHSKHGAWQESMHVFIQNGLQWYHDQYPNRNNIKIFEIGFGTGLNAFLSCQFAEENQLEIDYHSIELFPIDVGMANKLNYAEKSE
ncbi:MAG: methyltransferase, partial [Cyclobacteriaceae bacterium]